MINQRSTDNQPETNQNSKARS